MTGPLQPMMLALPCMAQCACSCSQWSWSSSKFYNTVVAPDIHSGARKVVPREYSTTLYDEEKATSVRCLPCAVSGRTAPTRDNPCETLPCCVG